MKYKLIYSEKAILNQFKNSMKKDNKLRKQLNAPMAKYDVLLKKVYFEYPDGRLSYSKEV